MKSLLEPEAHSEIKKRLQNLSENTERKWGKMTAAQMAKHCQGPLEIMLGHDNFDLKPNWFAKVFFKGAMYSDKLWRKNLPTIPRFKITEEHDLTTEKTKLESLLDELGTQLNKEGWGTHPAFGKFTDEQWGKMQYKHLDHHFRQFGI
ncbi:DUF1569 domain-containing protein [Constantimarinum furrinae]|uniref:DUF1569 domain-containing protein n=1 Tax=Constantimarinum furrinae TaxID=2562285 RepID=A0A7G8PUK2_9FLAO|nr:DUF1569 domain-containing protein [Constantimarinum furrinae]QNJ98018.1 hypothetical protein ALE3EI_1458 [Constantimarinum furrinae]